MHIYDVKIVLMLEVELLNALVDALLLGDALSQSTAF